MSKAKYWKGLEERDMSPEFVKSAGREFQDDLPNGDVIENSQPSRRDFLKYLGFSVTAATMAASCEMPIRKSIPYLVKPEEITPGIPNYYASSFFDGSSYNSVLVKTREGRPIKIEPNDLSPINGTGTSAAAQGSVLSLYDNFRPQGAYKGTDATTWDELDKTVTTQLEAIAAGGGAIRILSSTIISPSLLAAIETFKQKYPGTEHVMYDAVSYDGILNANEADFGIRAIPAYDFAKADLVVGLGADFLGNWVSGEEFSKDYVSRRKVSKGKTKMNRHIQVESFLSLTGSNADLRVTVKPSQESLFALALYNKVAARLNESTISGVPALPGELDKKAATIAAELAGNMGKSIVVSGSNDANVQTVVNGLNQLLGSYGSTISFDNHYNLRKGDYKALKQLVADVKSGTVKALLLLDANPVYNTPMGEDLAASLSKLTLSVSLNAKRDETSLLAAYHAPDHHYLESWADNEPKRGMFSMTQPTIEPLFKTRAAGESLLNWAGVKTEYYDYVKANWTAANGSTWDRAVHDGVFTTKVEPLGAAFAGNVGAAAAAVVKSLNTSGVEVVFYEKTAIGDGKGADNPWLQELPDPVSKVTWDNYAVVSEAFAEKNGWNKALKRTDKGGSLRTYEWTATDANHVYGWNTGGYAEVLELTINGKTVQLPVYILPGIADEVIAVAVGYGRTSVGHKDMKNIGVNVYPLMNEVNGTLCRFATGGQVSTANVDDHLLAQTQTHNSINDGFKERRIVKETTLDEYKKNPAAGNEDRDHLLPHLESLYSMYEYNGLKWGMSIDLNSCTGCGACVVACTAENNVPVVGKTEVARSREMHWLRIDRYFSGDSENPSVVFQPMLCQHCDNAPCENVCPVAATNHSSEGLNQMAYNRCFGTRYCMNNCPYKVRRFNWFDYQGSDSFSHLNDYDPHGMTEDLTRMVLNPDVTVRSRGVMEKCSFCVQRIQSGKLKAKKAHRPLEDSDITTACQSACATGAIVFGNTNNLESAVSQVWVKTHAEGGEGEGHGEGHGEEHEGHKKAAPAEKRPYDDRAFMVIEEIHTLPSIAYLTKVRNRKESEA